MLTSERPWLMSTNPTFESVTVFSLGQLDVHGGVTLPSVPPPSTPLADPETS